MKDDDDEARGNGCWILWVSSHYDQIETHRAGPIKEWELVKLWIKHSREEKVGRNESVRSVSAGKRKWINFLFFLQWALHWLKKGRKKKERKLSCLTKQMVWTKKGAKGTSIRKLLLDPTEITTQLHSTKENEIQLENKRKSMKFHTTYCTRSFSHFTTFLRVNQSAYFCTVISLWKSRSDSKQFPNPVREEIHSLAHVKKSENMLLIQLLCMSIYMICLLFGVFVSCL